MTVTEDVLYMVDESPIVLANDKFVRASEEMQDHVSMINAALHLISSIPSHIEHTNDDELAVQRLILRCFNAGAASLRLARCGYYQPAFSLVRDVIETTFLLDLFSRVPKEVKQWRTLPVKERESRFSTFTVRKKLDDFDPGKKSLRTEIYKRFSNYAAHPTPEGAAVISPDMMTKIGPFSDEQRFLGVLQELAKHLGYTAIVSGMHMPDDDGVAAQLRASYLGPLNNWLAKYMPNTPTITGASS
jgi:hypothetical protein